MDNICSFVVLGMNRLFYDLFFSFRESFLMDFVFVGYLSKVLLIAVKEKYGWDRGVLGGSCVFS